MRNPLHVAIENSRRSRATRARSAPSASSHRAPRSMRCCSGPGVPGFAAAVLLHQRAEESVIVEPRFFAFTKCGETPRPANRRRARKARSALQQLPLSVGLTMPYFTLPRRSVGQIDPGGRLRRNLPPSNPSGDPGARCSVVGSIATRADRVVGAVVAAGLVDRQQLHQLEADAARPIDELPQRREIADAEIVFAVRRAKSGASTPAIFSLGERSMVGTDDADVSKSK